MKKVLSVFFALCCLFLQAKAQNTGYKPGDAVTDFQLKNIDGKIVSLSGIPDAQGYIVIFTCNHCPYAKAYEDRIIQLHHQFATLGYPVVAINSNDPKVSPEDTYEKMKERAREKGFPFVYLYDETQEVARRFGAARTPHVYLVQNVKGKKIVQYIGAIDNNWEQPEAADRHYIEEAIKNLNENIPVKEPETKAIGCTIKWSKK